jgi:hypothetical protein
MDMGKPLYEDDQCLTFTDLVQTVGTLRMALANLKWWRLLSRFYLHIAIEVIEGLISWLKAGKPKMYVTYTGGKK